MYNSFIVLSVAQLPKTWNTGSPRFMFLMGIIFQATLNLIEDSKKANLIVRTIAELLRRSSGLCTVLVLRGSMLFVPTFLSRLTAHDRPGHMDLVTR